MGVYWGLSPPRARVLSPSLVSAAMCLESQMPLTPMVSLPEPRSALESRRVSLGAHWVDSRESSLLRRLERGREIGR